MYCGFRPTATAAQVARLPALNKSVSNLQAWLLSMQNFQQKTNSYLNQSAFRLVGAPDAGQGRGVTVAVIDTRWIPSIRCWRTSWLPR